MALGLAGLGCHGSEAPSRATTPAPAPREEPRPASVEEPPRPPISDDPVIEAIVDLAADDSLVDDHLRVLAVDIGSRLTGSTQLSEAQLWAVDVLASYGLRVTREPWGELPVRFERGAARGAIIRPERQELEFTTWAWTPGTHANEGGDGGLEAGGPIRGQALRYPEDAAELRAAKPYLRDAWIMIPWGFEGPGGQLRHQIEHAFERAPIAGLVWAAGGPEDPLIHGGGDPRLDPDALPERVEVRLRGDQHHAILQQMAAGEYVELEFAIANRLRAGPVPVANVIAELEGARWPEQRVVIGAHLDSWDGAGGALDGATGVATTIEAARLIALACRREGTRPGRTLSFMLWSGAKQEQLGSRAWVAAHPELLPEISAVLVHEGGTNHLAGLPVTPEMVDELEVVLAPVLELAPESMPFALRVVESLPVEASDSASFLNAGVPAFTWDQRGRSDDDRLRGTQHDHVDAVIDEYQRHSALVVAIAAWNLAKRPRPLPRGEQEKGKESEEHDEG